MAYYLLLHLPLHLGVALLAVAVVWMLARAPLSWRLGLLTLAALVQVAGVAVDVGEVFAGGDQHVAAYPLAGGGVLALLTAVLDRFRDTRMA